MTKTTFLMQDSIPTGAVYYETRFRLPNPVEKRLGIWVDRIGSGSAGRHSVERHRILGQYAAVAVQTGCGLLSRSGQESPVRLQAGDVIVITPAAALNYWSEPVWCSKWIVWNGPGTHALVSAGLLPRDARVIHGAAGSVEEAHHTLGSLMQNETATAALRRKAALLKLVAELSDRDRLANRRTASGDAAIERAIDVVWQQQGRSVSVRDMADAAGLSTTHFRRVFKASAGRTPKEFLTSVRMARARQLLASGASIKETAYATGFRAPAHFMRVFKRVTGCTAGAFARGDTGTPLEPAPGEAGVDDEGSRARDPMPGEASG